MTQQHTPTPWEIQYTIQVGTHLWCCEITADGFDPVTAYGRTPEEAEANAALIVKAVNHHEELVRVIGLAIPALEKRVLTLEPTKECFDLAGSLSKELKANAINKYNEAKLNLAYARDILDKVQS